MVTEPRRPWWQATRTPRAGFVLGGFWLVFALVRWWTRSPDESLALVLSVVVSVLLGAAYVASSVALLRRARDGGTTPRG